MSHPDTTEVIFVVETYDDAYLGRVVFDHGQVLVYSGYVGRPVRLDAGELLSLTPADEHPGVERIAG